MPVTANACEHAHRPLVGAHDHGHDHGHSHGHSHTHTHTYDVHRPEQRRALVTCIVLTTVMMVVEIIGGLWTGSLMLLSDAAHMLSHTAALFVSYAALRLAERQYDGRSHFGMYRTEILGALFNGLTVLAFTAWIAYEAITRFVSPEHVHGGEMTLIASLGLVVNLATAIILGRAGAEDLNTRSAFLHMLGDTLSSVAIVIGGIVLWFTGWNWIDPILSLIVACVILVWGVGLLRQSCSILLELAPKGREPETVRRAVLEECPEALDLHDVHVWQITSGYLCMTAHVVMKDAPLSETAGLQERIATFLEERFQIAHVTLQVESAPETAPA